MLPRHVLIVEGEQDMLSRSVFGRGRVMELDPSRKRQDHQTERGE